MSGIIAKAKRAASRTPVEEDLEPDDTHLGLEFLEDFLYPVDPPEDYTPPVFVDWFGKTAFTLVDWHRADPPDWFVLQSLDKIPVFLRIGRGDPGQLEVVESFSTQTVDGSVFWQTHGSFRTLADLGRFLRTRTDTVEHWNKTLPDRLQNSEHDT